MIPVKTLTFEEKKDKIIHIIRNVAFKLQGTKHVLQSIEKDLDIMWDILGDEGRENVK